MEKQKQQNHQFKLPDRLVTSVDLMRTIRELKYLDDWLNQASIRSGGGQVSAPKTSATLDEVARANEVSLLEPSHRQRLIIILESFATSAPKIHMSFAVEPSANFLNRMIVWLRANINPTILLDVGLQPALAAGCSVRTTNKLFDMSLRNRFTDSRHFLLKSIEEFADEATKTESTLPPTEQYPAPVTESAEQPQPVEATAVTPGPVKETVSDTTSSEAPQNSEAKV